MKVPDNELLQVREIARKTLKAAENLPDSPSKEVVLAGLMAILTTCEAAPEPVSLH